MTASTLSRPPRYLELPAGSYTLQTVGENYPDENSWRFEDFLTGQVYTGKVPTTASLCIGDMTAPCNRGTVSKSSGAAGLPPCECCTLGKYAPRNASAHGNACITCPSAFSLRGRARAGRRRRVCVGRVRALRARARARYRRSRG